MSEPTLFPEPPRADPVDEALAILDRAVAEHNPSGLWVGFSGGHDSLCAAHVASSHPLFRGCLHVNTGIGIEETRQYVRDTCERFGWPLKEYHPPVSYDEIVLEQGFPGPFGHRFMYTRLKERCLRQFVRDHCDKATDRVLLVTGVRSSESRRRMGKIAESNREGRLVWCAPIVYWTNADKHAYLERHGLPRNQVAEVLCMSGECLCGAFAKPGELDEIGLWFPEVKARINALEDAVKANGIAACKWGQPPPEAPDPAQLELEPTGMFCYSCDVKLRNITEAA